MSTLGLHHITAISSNAQKTYDFYTKILGLRFIKKTVNFDSPDTYHLYFGNESGEPGTALTFFPFANAGNGMRGVGQSTKIQFSVPSSSLGFWVARFTTLMVKYEKITNMFGNSVLRFYDFDGLQLELVANTNKDDFLPWVDTNSSISADVAIRGFFGVELSVENKTKTAELLTTLLGYKYLATEGFIDRYINPNATKAQYIDIFEMKGWAASISGAGTVHHVAFSVEDENHELEVKENVQKTGIRATEIIDRNYFKSVYFREPNGILFELATKAPGFTIDEPLESLGTTLQIPAQYESLRQGILDILPSLNTENRNVASLEETNMLENLFTHIFVDKNSEHTVLAFHGTGDNERGLVQLVESIFPTANILSLRGNISEEGMNRFFRRYPDGTFDTDSIEFETSKLNTFLEQVEQNYGIDLTKATMLGYSNGANFILSYLSIHKTDITSAILLHPMDVLNGKYSKNLKSKQILITSGVQDRYLRTKNEILNLEKNISKLGAMVKIYQTEFGHEISQDEIDWIKTNI